MLRRIFALSAVIAVVGSAFVLQTQSEAIDENARGITGMPESVSQSSVRAFGLESYLRSMAGAIPVPQTVDEYTTLRLVQADGRTISFSFEVAPSVEVLGSDYRAALVEHNCSYDGIEPLLREGAVIEQVFYRSDGSWLGKVVTNERRCDS